MNEHILFLIDHLANPGKYTQEELEENADAADYAYSTDYSYSTAIVARASATSADAVVASFWVDEYFKITGEDKQTYNDALGE
jgi:hypothetical protein